MVRLRYLKIFLGGWILVLLVVCGLAAPFLAPFDPQNNGSNLAFNPRPGWAASRPRAGSEPTIWVAIF